jgi:choline dehydrogenase
MPDYVIVGAGSAGCVLAARLTEDPDVSVTLIEAGPPDDADNIHIPAQFGSLFRTQNDWDYATVHEPHCDRRRIYLPRGKVIGGSSSINAMVYIRGSREDYDQWARDGATGWGYGDLLPYFKKSEDNARGASEYHGADGPLVVSEDRWPNDMGNAWLDAAQACGHARNDDFNAAAQDGVGIYQATIRDGRRCSVAGAYLHPVTERPNLTVETHLQVHRVLFEGGRAVGVEGQRLSDMIELRAEREVILAAGAYNSPQLLMLSGIGDPEQLTLLEIDVVHEEPRVGQDLQDHPNAGGVWLTSKPVSLLLGLEPENQQLWMEEGQGPLASNVASTGGFMRTRDGLPAPDIQFHIVPGCFADEGLTPVLEHGFSFGACVLKPASRGYVTLASADPTHKPLIVHNYYSEPEDLETMMRGLRAGYEIARTDPLAPYLETPFAACEDPDDDAALRAYIRNYTQTLYHPTSTCAIGTIVDDELRVNGVDGLRVVDASVMPTVVRGNTNAPTSAIAERAADLIAGREPLAPEVPEAAAATA